MYNIRAIATDEYAAWDKLVAVSPQAGLFQTTAWNQMLCETESQGQTWLPLVCEQKGNFLSGLNLRFTTSKTKKQADLPTFGYNGPFFKPQLEYEEKYQTISVYNMLKELLLGVNEQVERAVIQNQPEIWDIRPYKFSGWQIETSYTHLWHCGNPDNAWEKIDAELQKQISAITKAISIKTETTAAKIRQFSLSASKKTQAFGGDPSIHADTLEKRIRWMLQRDLCQFQTLNDQYGKEIAAALLVLSRENHTVYFWNVICADKKTESDLLPFLWWQNCLGLPAGFERIELGSSSSVTISQLKDQMGSALTPRFVARYKKR
jgi:hypothetical protein